MLDLLVGAWLDVSTCAARVLLLWRWLCGWWCQWDMRRY